jgi:hypothetical protein
MVLSLFTKAQTPDSLIVFTGYILDKDSLPIENALLVNFRTTHCSKTNGKGFFKIWLVEGDSLMLNHISYERMVIKANNKPPSSNLYFLEFLPYEIKSVSINNMDIEMENFQQNMENANVQMKENTPVYNFNSGRNIYAPPSAADHYAGINIVELISFIKTKKFIKRVKKNK